MMRAPEQVACLEAANRISHILAAPWPQPHDDRPGYDQCMNRLQSQITGEGGTYTNGGSGARIRLHGYVATSTEGLRGAAQNWISQVRAKLAA